MKKLSKPDNCHDSATCIYSAQDCVICVYKDRAEQSDDNRHRLLANRQAVNRTIFKRNTVGIKKKSLRGTYGKNKPK
jgi:hypothetical protein